MPWVHSPVQINLFYLVFLFDTLWVACRSFLLFVSLSSLLRLNMQIWCLAICAKESIKIINRFGMINLEWHIEEWDLLILIFNLCHVSYWCSQDKKLELKKEKWHATSTEKSGNKCRCNAPCELTLSLVTFPNKFSNCYLIN